MDSTTIILDNGHGKDTIGKSFKDFKEWEFNRDIVKRVSNKIESVIIVPEDEDIPLKERVRRVNERVNEYDNAILISIHADAFGNGKEWTSPNGWACFTCKGQTKSDKLADCLYKAAETFLKNGKGRKIRYDKSDGDADYEQDFYILKHTKCPAVLVENFFYTNKEDYDFLMSEEGRDRIADTIVEGLRLYGENV